MSTRAVSPANALAAPRPGGLDRLRVRR